MARLDRALSWCMSLPPFAVTYDYRCPFARNAHEHILDALSSGADWSVSFVPFSLSQVHVEEGGVPVWENPEAAADRLAMEASIVVAERDPARFHAVHRALFAARHDEGRDLRDESVVRGALEAGGADADSVMREVEAGWPLEFFRKAHESAAAEHSVFGVPTFIVGDRAVFVRLMTRPGGDGALARRTIEKVVKLVIDEPDLNEFKHTTISH